MTSSKSPSASEDRAPEDGTVHLDSVRGALRRMGYLDHRVERFLLQDALRPQRALRTVVLLSAKVGLLGGALAALVAALFLAAVNGLTRTSPLDVVPLFLHLVPPLAFAVGLSFLALAGIMAVILYVSHTRRIEMVSFAVAVVTALAALALFLVRGRPLIEQLERWQQGSLAILMLLIVVGLVRVIQSGLLSLSIRLSDHAPEHRASRWLWRGLIAAAAVTVAATLPALVGVAPEPVGAPSSLPTRPGARAVLIGVDGVLPEELTFVRARGELPALDARLADGGVLVRYPRAAVPPASFWTTVATGIRDPDHGMVSLDSFQPIGLRGTLSRSGWFRAYWWTVGRATGLVRYRPVLAHQRRAPAFWELAARGAVPGVAVNWWGTFPAVADAGLVLAHGGYRLLGDEVDGAVAPVESTSALRARLTDRAATVVATGIEPALASVLDRDGLTAAREQALRPDAFYREVFRDHLGPTVSAAALYLPALDVLPGLVDLGVVAFGEVVRWQLREVDTLIANLDPAIDLVVVVFDPGRRGPASGAEGRALIWRRDGCAAAAEPLIEPAMLASALIRTMGLPQSRELPEPPTVCAWPSPSLWVDRFGVRDQGKPSAASDTYLENLKSLGYL